MNNRFALFLILALFSGYCHATCHGNSVSYAPPITLDLSDKLTPATPEWTTSLSTQYSGSFSCTTGSSKFGYTKILNTDDSYETILGFNNGSYNIRAEITNDIPNVTLKGYSHSASELNTPMTIRFTLVNKSGTAVAGDTANLADVLFVTDLSGMSLLEIIGWPLKQLLKILQWLFSGFNWPYDVRDMFGQPMNIRYAPKLTTCAFTNPGMSVVLPTLGLNQVLGQQQPGYTPFTLNLRCDNRQSNATANRAIEVFLSSNTLLSGDATVLTDASPQAAKGLGLRLVTRDNPQKPVTLSSSGTVRGNATALFSVAAGAPLAASFSIPMGVYYYTWDPHALTQGTINTTATLNIIYP
ncbi:fimbrial protein [Pluralibacter gergoviae]|uniref:Fimbrial protein n=1 Tax=Pluralibacter gergoviae TaxID=61647 RepID=A0AAW8HQ93_PLUGE|nr:fimbrial protein [Pluralibacter gergoviae]AVR04991.1 fimbrial protein [Pluralibacter gergoviae]KJM65421.1 fimbrial protein [Pluralibacter gergoviae]KMK14019.1 fimbrial protein [Pluralibacter gergoviae]MDQ2310674.1 fimbrial protein [Pluralibacter gergoviae]OUR03728.1 fimbrial protein [Pluralibacter gergoviae]